MTARQHLLLVIGWVSGAFIGLSVVTYLDGWNAKGSDGTAGVILSLGCAGIGALLGVIAGNGQQR